MRKFILEEFINNARKIHGDRYSYGSEIDKVGSKFKVTCPDHGVFYITRSNHINNKQGCPICAKEYKITKHQEYIRKLLERSAESHTIKYDYSQINLDESVKAKQTVICPYHGKFTVTLDTHINTNSDCPKCVKLHRYNTEEFIDLSKKKFPNKFIYDNTVYVNNSTNVNIKCKIHGLINIKPVVHLRSDYGCQKCAVESVAKQSRLDNTEFLNRANKIHNDKYDYVKTKYINAKEYVIITCHKTNVLGVEHGDFQQKPHNHLNGEGCPKCLGKHKTTEEVVHTMKQKFGDLFDFSKFEFLGDKMNSIIICKKHGEFKKSYRYMMNSKHGCNKCEKQKYYYENNLYEFIRNKFKHLDVERNIRPDWLKNNKSGKNQELDIYIPSLKIAIEYQGRHHFLDIYGNNNLKHLQDLDLEKFNKCTELGIKLFYFTKDGRNIPTTYIDKIYVNYEDLYKDILLTINNIN